MAIGNFGIPFNQHTTQKFDIRTRPSKYAKSDIRRWDFEQSEGIRPAEVYGVYKHLPVWFKDTTTEDYVVIPKGRIVAALSTEDSTPLSGIVPPADSGYINIGHEPSELGSSLIKAQIDSSPWGYDLNVCGLLVPCNGGTVCSGFYTSNDVDAETLQTNGVVVPSGGVHFDLPANCPIGVAYHDIYQDIRGRWLNYQMHSDAQHVLTDWYVEIPYVVVDDTGSYSGVNPQYQLEDYSNLTKWFNVNKEFTYLTVNKNNSEVFRNGVFVQSDLIGNYKLQAVETVTALAASGEAPSAISIGSAYDNVKTNQTVGKILAIDNRFPKAGLEDVQTYPRSGMPGTQTAGMPKFLYDFVDQCITIGTGSAPTVEGVYDAIRGGDFGLVRIQLLVS